MSTRVERLRQRAMGSDYVVRSLTVKHEMFYASDLIVNADVIVDEHPVGNRDFGIVHTELFSMLGPHTSPMSYKRTSWKTSDGKPIQELSEVVAVLDLELRAFLMNRFNAELYDLTELILPRATKVISWWRRLFAWF